jgi:hypothetical protein
MKEYKVIVKHDKGKVAFRAYAENETAAREFICRAEGCPDSAVLKVQIIPYYVSMTDKFMSGWGGAEGKTNKFIIECETMEQAEIIQRNARRRSEMKYINICIDKPRYNKNRVVESHKTFEQLGEIWKQN